MDIVAYDWTEWPGEGTAAREPMEDTSSKQYLDALIEALLEEETLLEEELAQEGEG